MNVPYTIFGEELIEPNALQQFYSALEQPNVIRAALMPDAHSGYTLPIGAVIAVDGLIYPSYVGYDIGCSIISVKTKFKIEDLDSRGKSSIFNLIYKQIPTGLGNKNYIAREMDNIKNIPHTNFAHRVYQDKGVFDLGSLGHSNHFIEIGYDEEENLWISVHSGSRGTGHTIASNYMRIAGGKHQEGHYPFKINSEDGINYLQDLNFCLEFAKENRKIMMLKILEILSNEITRKNKFKVDELINFDEIIDNSHNHAELKDGLIIHRKGATHAEKDMLGVVPGSMATGCFIIKGKGNPDSLNSSSHGAGRRFSRKEAKETITMEDFKTSMDGIIATVKPGTLDESPQAYKDIFEVMKLQEDLVEIIHHIKPLINIKGLDNDRCRK